MIVDALQGDYRYASVLVIAAFKFQCPESILYESMWLLQLNGVGWTVERASIYVTKIAKVLLRVIQSLMHLEQNRF
jgi:hypothetical protein